MGHSILYKEVLWSGGTCSSRSKPQSFVVPPLGGICGLKPAKAGTTNSFAFEVVPLKISEEVGNENGFGNYSSQKTA
jgi:hypothetical protein